MRETSCRFLHAFFHCSILTLWRSFSSVVLGLFCALKIVRSVRLWHCKFHKDKRNIVDEPSHHQGCILNLYCRREYRVDMPYSFGHVLVHQTFRRCVLPAYMSDIQGSLSWRISGETLGGLGDPCSEPIWKPAFTDPWVALGIKDDEKTGIAEKACTWSLSSYRGHRMK